MKERGTFWRSKRIGLQALCLMFGLWSMEAYAQCTLACDNLVYVSLEQSCSATVGYTHLLLDPGACFPNDPEDYLVEIFNVQGSAVLPNSPIVDITNIGQTLPVKVTHLFSGSFCFAAIQVVDGLAPQINCPADLTIECTVAPVPSVTGDPSAIDCFPTYFTYVDQYISLGCQDPQAKIERTWTATDIYGNTNTCLQNIFIRLPDLTDIAFPPSYDNLDLPALDCQTTDLSPLALGAPNIQGEPLPEDNSCSFSAVYLDQVIPSCGQTFSIIRTWTVVEWCTGSVTSHPQIIKLEDQIAPATNAPDTLFFQANNPSTCTANLEFPTIIWEDDCSNAATIEILTPYGDVLGNGGLLEEVPIGTFYVEYIVTDDCGNVSNDSVWIVLQDQLAPTMACDQVTTINLDVNGQALVNATLFDDGSIDNCCLTFFQVARVESGCQGNLDFSPTVAFCCADAGYEIPLRLRAYDCFGNFNECSVIAKVEDPVAPALICPPNLTLSCLEDASPVTWPFVTEACGIDSIYYEDQLNLNTCSTGTIERVWYAKDIHENWDSCWQIITILDDTPIEIQFPADIVITDCGVEEQAHPDLLPVSSAYPVVEGEDCELLAISYADQVFTIATQSCLQIMRTWTVINWCEYVPNSGSSVGIYESLQVIEIIDDEPPLIDCPAEFVFPITGDSCFTTVLLSPPTIVDCTTEWTLTVTTPWGIGLGPYEKVPPGTYEVTYTVFDACGNGSTCTVMIEVEDEKKPTPICASQL
ncbi:MAG: HYR domain-containing protein, partial [Bacteroidota bacterium]